MISNSIIKDVIAYLNERRYLTTILENQKGKIIFFHSEEEKFIWGLGFDDQFVDFGCVDFVKGSSG